MTDPASQLIQLRPKENPKLFVDAGSNFVYAIYEDRESLKRAFKTVSFYNAVHRASGGEAFLPNTMDGKPLLIALQQRDLVVAYDASPEEVDWEDARAISERLYRVVKFDMNGTICLAMHNWSNVDVNRPKDYPVGVVLRRSGNTFKALKVRISITGSMHRAE